MNDPDVLQYSHEPNNCPILDFSAPWQFFSTESIERIYTLGTTVNKPGTIWLWKELSEPKSGSITVDTWIKTSSSPMGHYQMHFLYSSEGEFLLSDASCEQKIPIFLSIWVLPPSKDFIYPGIFAGWDGKIQKDYNAWFKVYTASSEWTQSFFS